MDSYEPTIEEKPFDTANKQQSVLTSGGSPRKPANSRLMERCERIRQRHTRVVRIERPSMFFNNPEEANLEPEREPLTPTPAAGAAGG